MAVSVIRGSLFVICCSAVFWNKPVGGTNDINVKITEMQPSVLHTPPQEKKYNTLPKRYNLQKKALECLISSP